MSYGSCLLCFGGAFSLLARWGQKAVHFSSGRVQHFKARGFCSARLKADHWLGQPGLCLVFCGLALFHGDCCAVQHYFAATL